MPGYLLSCVGETRAVPKNLAVGMGKQIEYKYKQNELQIRCNNNKT